MAILNNNPLVGASGNQGGYNINNSLRFRSSASAYLSRTPASAGNRKTWTFSTWVKRGALGASQTIFSATGANSDTTQNGLDFQANDTLRWTGYATAFRISTQVFRDPSAWYHIVVAFDSTQATATDRVKLYVNGSQITQFTTNNTITLNGDYAVNQATAHELGRFTTGGTSLGYLDAYQTEVNFIDGQALTPSSFGETDTTTGVWKPKAYTGTYGTNGFYLKFSDIATTSGSNAGLGKDFSGNSNYWTTNNISVTSGTTYDAMTDSPTNTSATVANYAVMSPINTASGITVSNANLRLSNSTNGGIRSNASISVSSGKWYFEVTDTTAGTFSIVGIGQNNLTSTDVGTDALSYGWYLEYAQKVNNGSSSAYGTALTSGDVCMVAFDLDNNKLYFGKNGTWFDSGNPATGTNPAYTITAGTYNPVARPYGSSTAVMDMNFGQRPFSYTPPTGYVALNTYNLPTSTILQGNKYMDATLYTGTGSSQSISGVNFQPDFVWIKERSGIADHGLYDAVRGVQKQLESNTTTDETTETTGLTAFNSNGFTVGALAQLNTNTDTYVGWSWKANGAGSSNTAGSITSTVSVNATAGFSIVTYTGNGVNGATVGHGLGVAPSMIIIKNRSATADWVVGTNPTVGAFPYTRELYLNKTDSYAFGNSFNNLAPTSSVFSIGSSATSNTNTNTYVAYCWAEIAGFSKFGSYTGNGSTDGPFVFTNLKARFIMIKRTDSTSNWTILDTAREGYNVDNDPLYPNLSDAEGTTDLADILSNGFKLRSTDTSVNANAGTYIYACFSSNPFKNSTAV